MSVPDQSRPTEEVSLGEVAQALAMLFATNSDNELQAVVEEYQHLLLTDIADQMLAAKIAELKKTGNTSLYEQITGVRTMLLHTREEHISATREKFQEPQDTHTAVENAAYASRILTDQPSTLDQTVEILRDAVTSTSIESPTFPIIIGNLAQNLYLRGILKGQVEDLEEAIRVSYHAIDYSLSSDNVSYLPVLLNTLSMSLRNRYATKGQREDLEQAIQAAKDATKRTKIGEPDLPLYLANLSQVLLLRYATTQQQADLDQAQRNARFAVESLSANSPHLPYVFVTQGNSLQINYTLTGQPKDLEQAIQYFEKAVLHTPITSPDHSGYLTLLGNALSARYERTAHLEDIEQSIEIYRSVMTHVPPDSSSLALILYYLSNALLLSYSHSGKREDVEEAIDCCHRALQFIISSNIHIYPALLSNLGVSLLNRYAYTSRIEDVEEAIKVCQEAVNVTPSSSPDISLYLTHLSSARLINYVYTGQLEELERSINTLQEAVQRTPISALSRPDILSRLVGALAVYYEETGLLAYLEQAIAVGRECVQLGSQQANFYRYLSNLGMLLGISYAHTGKREELEEMLKVLQEVVVLAPPDAPYHPYVSLNRVTSMFNRYERTGRLEDLDLAIDICRQTINHTPADATILSDLFDCLGLGQRYRYERTRKLEDLDQAMAAFEKALQIAPLTSPSRPGFLGNFGIGLMLRYQYTQQREDMNRAIEIFQSVLLTTAVDAPIWLLHSNNLSATLYNLYEHTGKLEDLEQSIKVAQEALKQVTNNSPDELLLLGNLSTYLRGLYEKTNREEDKQQAIKCYEKACQKGLELSLDVVFNSAGNWGDWAMKRTDWAEAARAYSYGLQAHGLLYREQLLRSSQKTRLAEARDMYGCAAYTQARTGQLREALVSLEQGRARGLGESLARDHADLEHLQQIHQDLYNRYITQIRRLQQLEHADLMGISLLDDLLPTASSPLPEQIRLAREAHEKTIAAIRLVPGYENFLAEPTYQSIVQASQPAIPLVYLTTVREGSMALLVTAASDEPEVIWADDFAWDDLLLTKYDDGKLVGGYIPGQFIPPWMTAVLTESLPGMGINLVRLVAQRLRELQVSGVVLIPTGLLGILPFHAAPYWLDDGREVCLLDEFDVAYAPSARVLSAAGYELQARRKTAGNAPPYLVGMGNPLPAVSVGEWAKSELQRIFPLLQQYVKQTLQFIKDTYPVGLQQKTQQGQPLTEFWEQMLQMVRAYSNEQPEQLIQHGNSLRQIASHFEDFPDLPDEVKVTLKNVSERIPVSLNYARTELESIQTLFPPEHTVVLYNSEATKDALWAALPQANLVHLTCHGKFDASSPLDSALFLAQDTRLTLRDLFDADAERLARLQLAVLSACQSATSDVLELPNEAMGMLSGFLRAGVPAVIGALWSVDQVSTALLMVRFYELYLYGDEQQELSPQQPLVALRQAQRWLRDLSNNALLAYLKEQVRLQRYYLPREQLPLIRIEIEEERGEVRPYAHPFYWAAFVYYGTW